MEEIKRSILDVARQTEPDLEVHIEEITEGLEGLAVDASALVNNQHAQPSGDDSPQLSTRREKTLEEERLALKAKKQGPAQSQPICTTATQRIETAPSQAVRQSFHIVFSGGNNSGLRLGQNIGVISNLK